jgi:hypothetical protein
MTRARQTISIALLVTSVRSPTSNPMLKTLLMLYIQLYLALFSGFIPLPLKIQQEIVPVVR